MMVTNSLNHNAAMPHDLNSIYRLFSDGDGFSLQINLAALKSMKAHLPENGLVIGREERLGSCTASVCIAEALGLRLGVSRQHAALFAWDEGLWLRDLGAKNGTYVNQQPLPKGAAVKLKVGDQVSLGNCRLKVLFQ